jgi:hypothetical protein
MLGTYQLCSEHLHRYLAEFDFRRNNRTALGVNDGERATELGKGIYGKRLTYRRPNSKTVRHKRLRFLRWRAKRFPRPKRKAHTWEVPAQSLMSTGIDKDGPVGTLARITGKLQPSRGRSAKS